MASTWYCQSLVVAWMVGRVSGYTGMSSEWLVGCRGSFREYAHATRLNCSNLNKYASISDFEHAVNHVNGVELTEGLYWR